MEAASQRLDDHPVVEVSPYQANMLAIWLTGHGAFGTFRLPVEEDWEACARAGRDGDTDEFGIPWCDENQQPIRNARGQEQFDSLSSHGANFDGKYPEGRAKR
ncbi:MAG: SUMF1/EgtB/PvdO family nonheme iron enzyme, partial [Planctomycetaceae bacterium]